MTLCPCWSRENAKVLTLADHRHPQKLFENSGERTGKLDAIFLRD